MGGCAAPNCSNNSRNNYRLFRFPRDSLRRKKWILNCRRSNWVPGPSAALCSVHFEESQYEQNRKDKWKKLKWNAIPTLFNVPKCSDVLAPKGNEGIVHPKLGPLLELYMPNMENIRFYSSQSEKQVEGNVHPNTVSSLFRDILNSRKQGLLQNQNELEEDSEMILSADHGYYKQNDFCATSNDDATKSIPLTQNISQNHAPFLLMLKHNPEVNVSKESIIIPDSINTMANSDAHTVMSTSSKDIKTAMMSNIKSVPPTLNMATVVSSPISNVQTVVLAPNNVTSQMPSSTPNVVYALMRSSSNNSNIAVPSLKNINSPVSLTTNTNTTMSSLSEDIGEKLHPSFMNTDNTSSSEEVKFWKNKYNLAIKKLRKALNEKELLEEKCKHIFKPDQIRFLEHTGTQPLSWSDETIHEALEIYSACGRSGYSTLLSKGYPLPSERTLRRKTQQYRTENDESD